MFERLIKAVIDLKAESAMWQVMTNCCCQSINDTRRIVIMFENNDMKIYAFSKYKPCCACEVTCFSEFVLGLNPGSDFLYGIVIAGVDLTNAIVQLRKDMKEMIKRKTNLLSRSTRAATLRSRPLPPPPPPTTPTTFI